MKENIQAILQEGQGEEKGRLVGRGVQEGAQKMEENGRRRKVQ